MAMQNLTSGIKQITPTYPIRPVQPSQKDREPGGKKRRKESDRPPDNDRDDEDKPTIDELV